MWDQKVTAVLVVQAGKKPFVNFEHWNGNSVSTLKWLSEGYVQWTVTSGVDCKSTPFQTAPTWALADLGVLMPMGLLLCQQLSGLRFSDVETHLKRAGLLAQVLNSLSFPSEADASDEDIPWGV